MPKNGMNCEKKGCRMVQILSPNTTLTSTLFSINPCCRTSRWSTCDSGMKMFFTYLKDRASKQTGRLIIQKAEKNLRKSSSIYSLYRDRTQIK